MTRELVQREGMFGLIQVLERKRDGARLFCIEGSVQTLMLPDGVSGCGYVHAIKLLAGEAQSVLMIGGGGGSLATMLSRQGRNVTVLDVDPVAEEIARAYFGLHESVKWITTDPIAFIESCNTQFDAVIIDACDAEGLVAPFRRPDILANILMKTCPSGSLIVNVTQRDNVKSWAGWVATKMAIRGFSVCLYRSEEGSEGNEVLHVRKDGSTDGFSVADLDRRPPEARTYLMSLRPHISWRGRNEKKVKPDTKK
jgi:precorrin-6B methylase 2